MPTKSKHTAKATDRSRRARTFKKVTGRTLGRNTGMPIDRKGQRPANLEWHEQRRADTKAGKHVGAKNRRRKNALKARSRRTTKRRS